MGRRKDNSRMIRSRAVVATAVVLAAAWCLPADLLAQGCAMCGTALQNARDPLTRSMASSILFMLSMPFLLFFSVAGWMAYRIHRAHLADGLAEGEPASDATHKENPS